MVSYLKIFIVNFQLMTVRAVQRAVVKGGGEKKRVPLCSASPLYLFEYRY